MLPTLEVKDLTLDDVGFLLHHIADDLEKRRDATIQVGMLPPAVLTKHCAELTWAFTNLRAVGALLQVKLIIPRQQ